MLLELSGKFWKVIPYWLRAFMTRRLQTTFTSSAAGIVVNEKGEVLLLDHLLRPASGWGIPGGFLEYGEQAHEAVKREIREECGIEISDIRLYRVRTLKRHIEVVFTAKGKGEPKIQSKEIRGGGWFALDDMPGEMNLQQQFMIRAALGDRQE
jgi:ADP-ribose pyrophosphatase YjhB (NUDIX family)